MKRVFLALCVATLFATTAHAQMRITEWMYNGAMTVPTNGGEFVEFTNVGTSAIDMTGWSFDDSSRIAGSAYLSAFGTVAAGESVILTDATADAFRTVWGSALDTVKIIGGNGQNLGRSDELNLYDAASGLVDRLTYNDQGTGTVKSSRTQSVSANILLANLGLNNASLSVPSVVADSYLSYQAGGDLGNPGIYTPYVAVPEPSTFALLIAAVVGLLACRCTRRK